MKVLLLAGECAACFGAAAAAGRGRAVENVGPRAKKAALRIDSLSRRLVFWPRAGPATAQTTHCYQSSSTNTLPLAHWSPSSKRRNRRRTGPHHHPSRPFFRFATASRNDPICPPRPSDALCGPLNRPEPSRARDSPAAERNAPASFLGHTHLPCKRGRPCNRRGARAPREGRSRALGHFSAAAKGGVSRSSLLSDAAVGIKGFRDERRYGSSGTRVRFFLSHRRRRALGKDEVRQAPHVRGGAPVGQRVPRLQSRQARAQGGPQAGR